MTDHYKGRNLVMKIKQYKTKIQLNTVQQRINLLLAFMQENELIPEFNNWLNKKREEANEKTQTSVQKMS